MKKTLLHNAIRSALGAMFAQRARTHDVSIKFRMDGGYPGDVNRTHPADIVAALMNSSVQAPRLFGDVVLVDGATSSYRGVVAGDTATMSVDGIVVRPYPISQAAGGMTASFGVGAPPTNQPLDVLRDGNIIVKCNVGAPQKGGAVYVYTGASTGSHVQGSGVETAAGANLTLLNNVFFNSPADANGYAEVTINRVKN